MFAPDSDRNLESLVVLIADSNSHSRRLLRMMLSTAGAKTHHEVGDGLAALDAIHAINPDIMIMDWDLGGLTGPQLLQTVRSPERSPKANLPVIVMTDVCNHSRVDQAMRMGANELLVRPISPKMLRQRLLGIVYHPRPMVRVGEYYVPLPRKRTGREELVRALPQTFAVPENQIDPAQGGDEA
jgi:PleD family two-component response regulator